MADAADFVDFFSALISRGRVLSHADALKMKISSHLEVLIGNAKDNIKCMRRDDKIRFSRFFSVGASS